MRKARSTQPAQDHRNELTDLKTAEHRGRLFTTMGEGLLIEFSSVVDAVECAVATQRARAIAMPGRCPRSGPSSASTST